jgi:hypothetical protein
MKDTRKCFFLFGFFQKKHFNSNLSWLISASCPSLTELAGMNCRHLTQLAGCKFLHDKSNPTSGSYTMETDARCLIYFQISTSGSQLISLLFLVFPPVVYFFPFCDGAIVTLVINKLHSV